MKAPGPGSGWRPTCYTVWSRWRLRGPGHGAMGHGVHGGGARVAVRGPDVHTDNTRPALAS